MSKVIDLTGQKYGRLTVIERCGSNSLGNAMWRCRCDCGNEIVIRGSCLTTGNTKSCGCYRREQTISRSQTHGKSHTRIHYEWQSMKNRCFDKKDKSYPDYGERGITVCPEWLGKHGAENFISWAYNNGYSDDLTIDRKDPDGNYCPENCRWSTRKEQANNKRNNILVTYNGETKTLKQWCEELNLDYAITRQRIRRNHWSIEKAFATK